MATLNDFTDFVGNTLQCYGCCQILGIIDFWTFIKVYFSTLKKWIGNQNGKMQKRLRKDTEDTTEEAVIKRRKGERKLSAQNVFYSRLSRQGILKSSARSS